MWHVDGHIKHESYISVKLRAPETEAPFWMDIAIRDGDVEADWNQYIFDLTNSDDVWRRDVQDNPDNFCDASGTAICYLEQIRLIEQDNNGIWKLGESYYR